MVRQRKTQQQQHSTREEDVKTSNQSASQHDNTSAQQYQDPLSPSPSPEKRSKWVILAIASGMFAATNGLFAKLTTTHLTTTISQSLIPLLPLSLSASPSADRLVEYIIRSLFFALNLISNAVMWTLFTRALTSSPSTTKVSITNTTANFLLTAVLGMVVFGEEVGGLWWVGAGMMGVGCVVVGMREEGGGGDGEGEKKKR
ncbi:hypothetical protein AJ80_01452 [Polytolypa hystricis UAMH7299]|uniref:EamA domain-containing protein n=1 Tax=Polytolypa hystricis (strain UAMH7299) TaxID=1447883 RepID=A0A2B7Z0D0_POLH7|nr:hypothetical protein AJ80_01452 [Polytolypa hystricis UAMH7299]